MSMSMSLIVWVWVWVWRHGRHQWQQVPLGGRQETTAVPRVCHCAMCVPEMSADTIDVTAASSYCNQWCHTLLLAQYVLQCMSHSLHRHWCHTLTQCMSQISVSMSHTHTQYSSMYYVWVHQVTRMQGDQMLLITSKDIPPPLYHQLKLVANLPLWNNTKSAKSW